MLIAMYIDSGIRYTGTFRNVYTKVILFQKTKIGAIVNS